MNFINNIGSYFKKPGDFSHFLLIELSVVILAVLVGALCFHYVEGWAFFDSVYFIVITMATIGYGDFVPLTVLGKVFAMIYAIMGVPLFVYTTSMILDYRFKNYMKRYVDLMHSEKSSVDHNNHSTGTTSSGIFGRVRSFFGMKSAPLTQDIHNHVRKKKLEKIKDAIDASFSDDASSPSVETE